MESDPYPARIGNPASLLVETSVAVLTLRGGERGLTNARCFK